MIDNFVVEGFTFDQVMNDDEALEAFVRKAAIGVWHASCTCRMGRADDPMAVVDTQGRVQGRAGPARGRRLDLPGGALRQHQLPDPDDGREDRRSRPRRSAGGLSPVVMSVRGGSGEHRYRVVENWAKLPGLAGSSATSPPWRATARTGSTSSTAANIR